LSRSPSWLILGKCHTQITTIEIITIQITNSFIGISLILIFDKGVTRFHKNFSDATEFLKYIAQIALASALTKTTTINTRGAGGSS
jgi:hypothetical protein